MCRSHSPEDCRNGFEVDDDDEPSKGENFLSETLEISGTLYMGKNTWNAYVASEEGVSPIKI